MCKITENEQFKKSFVYLLQNQTMIFIINAQKAEIGVPGAGK